MCKMTNKSMFVSGLGLSMLVYYCATSFPILNVLNPKGGRLDQISIMPKEALNEMGRNDVFLESVTGDYYGYNRE